MGGGEPTKIIRILDRIEQRAIRPDSDNGLELGHPVKPHGQASVPAPRDFTVEGVKDGHDVSETT